MANISNPVTCPSCDAAVPIKPAQIGKKVSCPKCAYRFVIPAADEPAAAAAKPAKSKSAKSSKSGGKTKLLVGAGVGVLAVVALGVAAFMLMGGEETPKQTAANTTTRPPQAAPARPPAANTDAETPNPDEAPDDGEAGDAKPASGETKPAVAATPAGPRAAGPGKDITNLLPNDTTAVWRVNYNPLSKNATPIYNAAFDSRIRELVKSSLLFPVEHLVTSIHCVVGPNRLPFVVTRTKYELDTAQIYQKLKLGKDPVSVGSRVYYVIESNPLIDALANAFTTRSVAKLFGLDLPAQTEAEKEEAAQRKYALVVYDASTLMIADTAVMERFLLDLDSNGFPPFKSQVRPEASEPAPGGDAGGPGGSGGPQGLGGDQRAIGGPSGDAQPFQEGRGPQRPGGPPVPTGIGGGPPGGAPGTAGAPGGTAAVRLYTSVPTYRTIDPSLKRLLNQLEEDPRSMGGIIYAEALDQSIFNSRQAAAVYQATGNAAAGAIARLKRIGMTLLEFNRDKGRFNVVLEFNTEEDAKKTVTEFVGPILQQVLPIWDFVIGTNTTLRGIGGGGGGSGGFPGAPGGLVGSPGGSSGPPGGYPGQGGQQRPGGPPGNVGGGGDDAQGGPGGPGGPPPGYPGAGYPGAASGAGDEILAVNAGLVNLAISDRVVTTTCSFNWPENKYNAVIQPVVARLGTQFRGKVSVLTGDIEWHRVASVADQLKNDQKPFPRGTLVRQSPSSRFNLPHPPEHRASFFVDLLPYLGHASLRSQIDAEKKPWYAKENLPAAEAWIPELLVPYYPQDSWRAVNSLAPGKSLGGTNYVGLAGVGLDAGRYDPANPADAKRVGIVGYNWSSKPEDVTDGLSNTIFLAQVAPGPGRPWIAGGGATVLGVPDTDNPMQPFINKGPDGRRGTYVAMADGSVRFIKEGADAAIFKALVTRAGGESIADLDGYAERVKATKSLDTELRSDTPIAGATETAPKDTVDADELKKFQGVWKLTYVKSNKLAKLVGVDDLADRADLRFTFEDKEVRARMTINGQFMSNKVGDIVNLNPKSEPQQLDLKSEKDGKSEISLGIYEFPSPNKLKIRAADDGKPRPDRVAIPGDGSEDEYMELERAD